MPGKAGPSARTPTEGARSPFALPDKSTPAAATRQPVASPPERSPFALPGRKAAEALSGGQQPVPAPPSARELVAKGLALAKAGKLDQDRAAYQKSMEADRGYAVPHKNLGVLMEQMGRRDEAVKAYRRYLALAPGASDAAAVKRRAAWLESRVRKGKR